MKDASVLEESNLRVSVKSARRSEGFSCVGRNGDVLADAKVSALHVDVEGLSSIKAVSIGAFTILEL